MPAKVYSKVDELPSGLASENITKGCICLEGGAFRGLYSGGALDAMMLSDINMECVVGVSAGSMNGISYATGQIGYGSSLNLTFRHDSRYVGLKALKKNKGLIGFDFIFSDPTNIGGLKLNRITDLKRRFVAVVTNCLTGKAEFLEYGKCKDICRAIQASSSMPFISKMVDIDGTPYLDGGCSCKIPFRWALEEGYEKIIVIKTRDASYRKPVDKTKKHRLTRIKYRKYPKFRDALLEGNEKYNEDLDYLDELEKEGRIFVLTPSKPLTAGRLERDMEKLGATYQLGFDDAMAQMERLKNYLNS